MASRLARHLSPTLGRFLVVGGVSYVVNQTALYLLYDHAFAGRHADHGFDKALLLASVIAVEVSILVRFSLNDAWTFRGRCDKPLATRFYQFNLSSFGSPLISLAAVNILTPQLGISYLVANSLGIAVGLAWNWLCSLFIWPEPPSGEAVIETQDQGDGRRALSPANSHR
jgi:putative flippase GtrA